MIMFEFNHYIIQQSLERILELGFTKSDYFAEHPEHINTPINQIPEDIVAKLIRHSRVLVNDEMWGYLPTQCPIGTYNYAFQLADESLSIKDLLPRIGDFYETFIPDMTFGFNTINTAIDINLPKSINGVSFPYIFIKSIVYLTLCWLTGKRLQLQHVETHLNKSHIPDGLEQLFGCPIITQAKNNRLYLQKNEDSLMIIRSKNEIQNHLETRPLSVIRFNKTLNYSSQVQQYLCRKIELHEDMKDLNHAAKHFGMTSQSLRRQLAKQNLSFREIKQKVQQEKASHMLSNTELSIEKISTRLGFIESNSFPRAFRRWTGLSPSEFRENNKSNTLR